MRSLLFLISLVAVIASTTIGFAQGPPARGSASVRVPAWRQLRTAVGSLMGWQVGVPLGSFRSDTFMDAARKAEALDLAVFEGDSTQKVSLQIPKALDYRLAPGERAAVLERMAALNVRMVVYSVADVSDDAATARKQFEFAKALGVDIIAVDRVPSSLAAVERLADEYAVNVAVGPSPKSVADVLKARGPRIGMYADLSRWSQSGMSAAEGISLAGDRLLAVRVGDRSAFAPLLSELNRRDLKPAIIVTAIPAQDVSAELLQSLEAFERAAQPLVAERVMQLSRTIPIKGPDRLTPEEREGVKTATPARAAAKPKAARRLLVYDANIGYGGANGGHRSIPAANMAVELFAKATGAFEPVFSNDLENFKYDRLRTFDAVFLNNTVGQIFVDPEVRAGLSRFVREGGGLAAYHGASHASMDWPEFAQMLGAVEGSHREPTEIATVKIDDPGSPLMTPFAGQPFEHQDEFYRFVEPPLSRDTARVLMSIDVEKTDLNQGRGCARPCVRPDSDYALSWIRTYGKGRVFFTSLGHTPAFFSSAPLSEFFFRGIQFALGDLEADTTPSAKLATTTGR
jgi:type 1 glutamine amidotransferase